MGPPKLKSKRRNSGGGGPRLTQLLAEVGQSTVMDADGVLKTYDEMLVHAMWKAALGLTEVGTDDNGPVYAPPDAKMQLAILERREGKTPSAMPDKTGLQTAAARVSDIARASINSEADALAAVPEHSQDMGVPCYRDQDTEDSG